MRRQPAFPATSWPDSIRASTGRGAAGHDLDRLRGDLEAKIESRSTALEGQIAELRGMLEAKILAARMNTTKWVAGTQAGTSAIFLAALLAALKL